MTNTTTFRNETKRAFAFDLFVSLLPQRTAIGNTAFRKQVLVGLEDKFNMTRASAAATYNAVKKAAVAQGLCEEFGRAASTPKVTLRVNVVRAKDKQVVAEDVTVAEAQELVAKAIRQKKAKLELA